jgi:AraC-like DNA-binding protein
VLITNFRFISTEPAAGLRSAVQVVRSYLEENYAATVSLDQLARLVNLSPFHLAHLFRQEVGMPPHAFQLQLRLSRARGLLLQGRPVSEVATETGFFDLSHFTRHFKRQFGVTPGNYLPDQQ